MDQVAKLRLLIDDPHNGQQDFDNTVLAQFISDADGDLNAAASELWGVKAGTVADWYQVNVDGSFMSREQVFEHCLRMQAHFKAKATSTSDPVFSSTGASTPSAEY